MNKNNLVTSYAFQKITRYNIYSAGPDIFFDKPCIGYIRKGYAKFLYKGNTIYASEGDLIYIAFETRYQSIWYGSPDVEWYSISFDFGSKTSFYDYRFQILKNYPAELFEKMYQTYEKSPMLAVSYFYELLDDIYKKMQVSSSSADFLVIEPAIEYLESNYNKAVSVKNLAQLCHISESGFFKLFKKLTGATPIEYKHNIMIQHAIELLTNSSLSIEEVSQSVGFSSSNYFRKVFCELTDKKPRELRRN